MNDRREVILLARKIPATIPTRYPGSYREGFPGVYIWFFNQHFIDSVLYIGQSGNVWERLYDEYRAPSGFISKWIDGKMLEKPIYCDKYSDPIIDGPILKKGRCDCLPRLKVKVIACDESEMDQVERFLIGELNPLLNKMRYERCDTLPVME